MRQDTHAGGITMKRLLVKVQTKALEKRYRDRNGLEYGRYRLGVRVEGSAIAALAVPERVVGRKTVVRRDFMLPWGVKKGDLLVLDPTESGRILGKRGKKVDLACARAGSIDARSGDVDKDGYDEDILANAFLTAVVQAHRGARVLSLKGCSGEDRLAQPNDYVMGGKYILLGGVEEILLESGSSSEIWKSAFKREEPACDDESAGLTYSRDLESPEGATLTKEIRVERDFPGLEEHYVVRYAGKPEKVGKKVTAEATPAGRKSGKKAKKKEDTAEVTFGVRLSTSSGGGPGSRNVFDLPGAAGLQTIRYHRPAFGRRWRWRDWRDEHFGLRSGYFVSRNEQSGRAMAVIFNPRTTALVAVRSDYQGPEIMVRHVTRTIRKGRRAEYGIALLLGDRVTCSAASMFLVSRGRAGRGGTPYAFTVRTRRRLKSPPRVTLTTAAGPKRITLRAREIREAGTIYTKTITLPKASSPDTCTASVAGERLTLDLKEGSS